MKYIVVMFVSTCTYMVSCLPPPHPAVVAVRREEEQLPPYLRSPALRNPHLQEVLPLTSLLHPGEKAVYQREADDVPRQEIYNILTHAGFVPRKPLHQQPSPHHRSHQRVSGKKGNDQQNFFDPPLFSNPELLQYL